MSSGRVRPGLRELDAVTQTFAGDARPFATLALETYCPS